MTALVDLTGRRFARLLVVSQDGKIGRRIAWRVRCDCGTEKRVVGYELSGGGTRSCGCLLREVMSLVGKRTAAANSRKGAAKAAAARTRHGHATDTGRTPTYGTWEAMGQRCNNPKNKKYNLYGGRGVTVCERWRVFANFLADMGERPVGKTLDRINPFGNYEPGNCRWATAKEQANNLRRHHAER